MSGWICCPPRASGMSMGGCNRRETRQPPPKGKHTLQNWWKLLGVHAKHNAEFFVWQDNNWYFPFYNYYFFWNCHLWGLMTLRWPYEVLPMIPILTGNFMALPHSSAFELNIKISALSHSLNDEVVNKLETWAKVGTVVILRNRVSIASAKGWISILMNGPRKWNSPFELL